MAKKKLSKDTYEDATVVKDSTVSKISFMKGEVERMISIIAGFNLSGVSSSTRLKLIKLKLNLNKYLPEIKEIEKEIATSIKPENFDEKMAIGTAENANETDKFEWQEFINDLDKKYREELTPFMSELIEVDYEPIEDQSDFDKLMTDNNNLVNVAECEYIYYKLFKQ